MNNLMKNLAVDEREERRSDTEEERLERSDTEEGDSAAVEELRPDVDISSPRPRTSSPLCPGAPPRRPRRSSSRRERLSQSPLSSPIHITIPDPPRLTREQREVMDGLDGRLEVLLPRRRRLFLPTAAAAAKK